ncbi:MLO-like protein 13 isoform X2 [Neltuma alba]|uniref:MLO-like protein 13 isoform X2 n=1 Tax=Neltuma alba TaxID=207710 RepID=UPI0010A35D1A|nr:MLO-like protein 13 isoform X2 [Prosopis alba]
MAEEPNESLEYTPTWTVAVVCSIIVGISFLVERGIHRLGKYLEGRNDALNRALEKLKEELMLLGFISLLLTVFQGSISRMCIPPSLVTNMLPCKRHQESTTGSEHNLIYYNTITNRRRLFSEETSSASKHCTQKGKVPLLSLESLHHLHIFIFVLAVVHVIFCVSTMLLGSAKIRRWKKWELDVHGKNRRFGSAANNSQALHEREFIKIHAEGFWRKAAVISWIKAFFKQFHGSVTESDYVALRHGFIKKHVPGDPNFDFHKYMMGALEDDFKKVVGISWYLWLFVVLFLLLNLEGWHTYFWLAFLPLILLLLVGAKLEYIISRLAQESVQLIEEEDQEAEKAGGTLEEKKEQGVKPSDKHFWFGNPALVLDLIHFILFQNSFEIAFFFWILLNSSSALQLQHLASLCSSDSDGKPVEVQSLGGIVYFELA